MSPGTRASCLYIRTYARLAHHAAADLVALQPVFLIFSELSCGCAAGSIRIDIHIYMYVYIQTYVYIYVCHKHMFIYVYTLHDMCMYIIMYMHNTVASPFQMCMLFVRKSNAREPSFKTNTFSEFAFVNFLFFISINVDLLICHSLDSVFLRLLSLS